MKYLIGFVLLLTACSSSNQQTATVPCSKLHLGGQGTPSCPRPFMEGNVNGQWLGLVIDYTGADNGIDNVKAFSIGQGQMSPMTFDLGTITGEENFGRTGDMDVRFVNGKLWVINPHYDNQSQSRLGFTQALVRQYGFYGGKLVVEKRAFAAMPSGSRKGSYPSNASISAALQGQ